MAARSRLCMQIPAACGAYFRLPSDLSFPLPTSKRTGAALVVAVAVSGGTAEERVSLADHSAYL